MGAQLSYPGVYVEEIPSGVRTITGVATSIAAFIGRAGRGPVDTPTTVFGFEEFSRRFGGLWRESTLGYAVQDFFANGGARAEIVRLTDPTTTPARLTVGGLALVAAEPGSWGVALRAEIDKNGTDQAVADEIGVARESLFNLTVREASPGGRTEAFHNLSTAQNARNVAGVLAAGSALVRVDCDPAGTPGEGRDALGAAEQSVAETRGRYQRGEVPRSALDAAELALRQAVDAARAAVSDGAPLTAADFLPQGGEADHRGLYALDHLDLFNLLCIPPHQRAQHDVEPGLISAALAYCRRRRAVLLIDPREDWKDPTQQPESWLEPIDGPRENAAVYFPRLRRPDPEQGGLIADFVPCGAVAGVLARTDAVRGVWKAGAGLEAGLVGVPDLSVRLSDGENGLLNPLGVNCLRAFPVVGRVVWG
ncbi:hypothetical protein, partial [Kitasatospora sp. NPDC050543]|uniref:hypothetical protein n=1 Tax=Kitasatospora sp. NPDC050543 TaxID=3364054 RepID=UPI0037AC71FF